MLIKKTAGCNLRDFHDTIRKRFTISGVRLLCRFVESRTLSEVLAIAVKVFYDEKITKVSKLHGIVACELSSATFGPAQWWMLLEQV